MEQQLPGKHHNLLISQHRCIRCAHLQKRRVASIQLGKRYLCLSCAIWIAQRRHQQQEAR